MKTPIASIVIAFALGLLCMGALRYVGAGLATPGYVVLTISAAILMTRHGVPLNRLGFAPAPNIHLLLLALAGIAVLQLIALFLSPLIEVAAGSGPDLQRFAEVEGSVSALVILLALNWTFAAFGEELAYRILLMRGIAYMLGDTVPALATALLFQALIFGLVHTYQGAAGVVESTISGLVFGALTLLGRGSIWPAALAHGGNNTISILLLY